MNPAISSLLFYIFALAALVSAIGVVSLRNPVSSALSLALCFGFVAAIFFNMGATFLGITQIIVYAVVGVIVAGMLAGMISSASLQLPGATDGRCPWHAFTDAFCEQLSVDSCSKGNPVPQGDIQAPAPYGGSLPALNPEEQGSDAKLLGENLFSYYNLTFVILGFALLAGCVGAVSIGRRLRRD